MLDDFELPLVQVLHTDEDQVWVEHAVPGLEGSLFQRLGRAPARIRIEGALVGDDSLDSLEKLRKLYHAGQAVPFTADIMTATDIKQVVIDELIVKERAGRPQVYDYTIKLIEFIPTPEPTTPPDTPDNPDDCDGQTGTIEVTVELPPGQSDFTGIVVRLQRTDVEGAAPIELTEQTGGVYRREHIDHGEYRATAFRRS